MVITSGTNPRYKTFTQASPNTRSITITGNTISTGGIILGGGGSHAISTGGFIQSLSDGAPLYLFSTAGAGTPIINSPIQDYSGGIQPTTLVYSGTGTISLNAANTYSGGTVINGGTLEINNVSADTNLGAIPANPATNITFNGSGTLSLKGAAQIVHANRTILINSGAVANFDYSSQTVTIAGKVTGDGSLFLMHNGNGNVTARGITFSNPASDFTGSVTVGGIAGNAAPISATMAGLVDDATHNGMIRLGGVSATAVTFNWSGDDKTLNNRQIDLAGPAGANVTLGVTTAGKKLSVNTDLLVSGAGAKTFTLTGAGNGEFAGKIVDGNGTISLSKLLAGTWTIGAASGTQANTYTGGTSVGLGTLIVRGKDALGTGAVTLAGGTIGLRSDTDNETFGTATTTMSAASGVTVDRLASGTGLTLKLGNLNVTAATTGTLTTSNANGYVLGLGSVTQSATTGTTLTFANAGPLTIADFTTLSNATPKLSFTGAGIATITGNIQQGGGGPLSLEHVTGAGTVVLQGTSNMTGAVLATTGTIQTAVATNAFGSTSGITIGGSGILALRSDSSATFGNGTTAYPVATSGSGATINVDRVSSAAPGTTITLGTVSLPGTHTLNVTGANGVGLSLGAVTASTAGDKIIANAISGGGALTIASYTESDASIRAITFSGVGNTTVSGAISQNGANALSVSKGGAGTLTLAGNNTYTGTTTIALGTLLLSGAGTLGTGAGPLSLTGGQLDLGGLSRSVGAVSITTGVTGADAIRNGTLAGTSYAVSNASGTVAISANLAGGAAGLTKTGAGILTLNGANTFSGGVTLSAGILNVNNGGSGSNSALGTGRLTISGGTLDNTSGSAVVVSTNNLQTWDGNFAFTGSGSLNLGTGAVGLGTVAGTARTLTVNGSTLAVGGVISNGTTANSLIKAGVGALTLSGANTFSGGVTLSAGTLNVNNGGNGSASALGTGRLSISGGTLDNTLGSDVVIGTNNLQTWDGNFAFTGSGNLNLGTGAVGLGTVAGTARTVTVNGGMLTVGGVISDGTTAKALIKAGNGTLVLGGANGYTTGTTVSGGILMLSGAGTLGATTGPLALSGGQLDLGGLTRSVGAVTVSAPAGSGDTLRNGSLTGTSYAVSNASGTVVISAALGGAGGVTKTGAAGTVSLAGPNTYTGGTTITSGTVRVAATETPGTSGPLGASGTITFAAAAGGILQFSSANTFDYSSRFAVTAQSINIDTNGQSVSFASPLMTGVAGNLTKSGDGTLTLTAVSSYTGGTTVNGGTLALSGAGRIPTTPCPYLTER